MDSIDPDTPQSGRPSLCESVTNSIEYSCLLMSYEVACSLVAVGPFLTRGYTIQECRPLLSFTL